ncbi:MAG: ABC transporter permease [Bryobacterales bacterium]|nr:ABC transporter permease [Bryobacterales bacterium]
MNWTRIWNRLTGRPAQEAAAFDEEYAFHLDMKTRELEAAGLAPEAARREARRGLGNVTLAREQVRETWSFAWLTDAMQDLRYGARSLATQPGFTAAAVLALVLGIGVNAVVFNIYNALALAPFALRDAHQTVLVWGERGKVWQGFNWPEYRYLRQHAKTLDGLTGSTYAGIRVSRGGGGGATATEEGWNGEAIAASEDFFQVVGTGFTLGRGFSPEAGRARNPAPEIVLHHDTWVTRFGSDPALVGQWLNVNGHQLQVVGVAAAGFSGPAPTSPAAWIPISWRDVFEPGLNSFDSVTECCANLIGRLRAGHTRAQATAELTGLISQFRKSVGQDPGRVRLTSPTLLSNPKAQAQGLPMFIALAVTALLILLLACANVANLQIARAVARRREMSVRLALGAGRGRVLRQLLTESFLLAALAGAISFALAGWGPARIVSFIAGDVRGLAIRFDNDYRVLTFVTVITILAALVSGLAPAWGVVREAVNQGLREGRAAVSGSRLRYFLLAAQVALSAVLVSGTMLMVRVADHARQVDPGFTHHDVIHMQLGLGPSGLTDEQAGLLINSLTERIAALPGVVSTAHSIAVPFSNTSMSWGGVKDPSGKEFKLGFDRVSASFHQTLRIALRAGAGFPPNATGKEELGVINQAAAERIFPGENPIGKPIQPDSKIIVAGVTGTVVARQLGMEHNPHIWVLARASRGSRLLIRHAPGARDTLLAALPAVARQHDTRLLATAVPYSDTVASGLRSANLTAGIAAGLGSLALLLACVGIYGVAAYNVSQRTREIGVRMALGAQPAGILAMVLRQNLRTVLVGAAVGLVGALAFGQLLKNSLYGVSPADPLALGSAISILIVTALLATWAPARRAAGIDPSITLRED